MLEEGRRKPEVKKNTNFLPVPPPAWFILAEYVDADEIYVSHVFSEFKPYIHIWPKKWQCTCVKPSHQMLQQKTGFWISRCHYYRYCCHTKEVFLGFATNGVRVIEKIQIIAGLVIRSHSLSMRSATEEGILICRTGSISLRSVSFAINVIIIYKQILFILLVHWIFFNHLGFTLTKVCRKLAEMLICSLQYSD